MIPGTLAYSWLGYAGREAAEGSTDAIQYGVIGLAAIAAIAFVPRLLRRWRETPPRWIDAQQLSKTLSEANRVAVLDVRSDAEFNGPLGHIRGAVNIPVDELAEPHRRTACPHRCPRCHSMPDRQALRFRRRRAARRRF